MLQSKSKNVKKYPQVKFVNNFVLDELVVGTITDIRPYGALIYFEENRKGLLHIKQISDSYISNIKTYLKINSSIKVRIIEIDETNGFLKLSLKSVPHSERIIFDKEKGESNINPTQIDFTMLKEALPVWIDKAMEEINNDKIKS